MLKVKALVLWKHLCENLEVLFDPRSRGLKRLFSLFPAQPSSWQRTWLPNPPMWCEAAIHLSSTRKGPDTKALQLTYLYIHYRMKHELELQKTAMDGCECPPKDMSCDLWGCHFSPEVVALSTSQNHMTKRGARWNSPYTSQKGGMDIEELARAQVEFHKLSLPNKRSEWCLH